VSSLRESKRRDAEKKRKSENSTRLHWQTVITIRKLILE